MKFNLTTISIVFLMGLSSCVTSDDIKVSVRTLKGQNYKAAFAKLGFPDGQSKIAGYTVYTWANQNSGSYIVPSSNTTTTYANGQAIRINIRGSYVESFNHHCKLKLLVDTSGTVVDTKIEGNVGGCKRYAQLAPNKKSS